MRKLSFSHVQKHPQEGNSPCTAPRPTLEEDGEKNAPTQQLQCAVVCLLSKRKFSQERATE